MPSPSSTPEPLLARTTHAAHSSSLSDSHHRRPSLSSSMQWISAKTLRAKPSKPTRISEPKLIRSIDLIGQRAGVLGQGAQVVRTPDEALRDSGITYVRHERSSSQSAEQQVVVPPPDDTALASPPLPPLPDDSDEETDDEPRSASVTIHDFKFPMLIKDSDDPIVPSPPLPPPFNPILLSEYPDHLVDRSKVVVTIETSTANFRTTIETLTRCPSRLASYIDSLFPRLRTDSTVSSVYSTSSDDISTFKRHLASQGLLAGPHNHSNSTQLSLFLDRPSDPYNHILAYLRSPDTLPRAVRLQPMSHARLDILLELRDEAIFLDLEDLARLCTEEIQRHAPRCSRHYPADSSLSSLDTTTLRNSGSSQEKMIEQSPQSAPHNATQFTRTAPHLNRNPPAGWI